MDGAGLNLTTMDGYYIVTLNSTVMVNGQEVNEQVALAQSLEGGMWKSCSVTPGEFVTQKLGYVIPLNNIPDHMLFQSTNDNVLCVFKYAIPLFLGLQLTQGQAFETFYRMMCFSIINFRGDDSTG